MSKQTPDEWVTREISERMEKKREVAERTLKTPLIDRLIKNAKSNPAAATVLAEELLLEWDATQDVTKRDQARNLLWDAADQGDPEACWRLAELNSDIRIDTMAYGELNANLVHKDFRWCSDKQESNFRYWALQCDHSLAREYQQNGEDAQEMVNEQNHDMWLEEQGRRKIAIFNRINKLKPFAESGNARAQYLLGTYLWEDAVDLDWKDEPNNQQADIALGYIEQASQSLPEACHFLAIHKKQDSATTIRLLQSAADSPYGEKNPYVYVNLVDALEESGDPIAAEECLRQSLKTNNVPELKYKLAMLLLNYSNHADEKLVEARNLLMEAAESTCEFEEEAEFTVSLMLIRGEGGNQDLERAHEMLKRSSKRYQSKNNEATVFSANLALLLGWGEQDAWELAVELMVRRLVKNNFKADQDISLTWDDIIILIGRNNNLQVKTNLEQVTMFQLERGFAPDRFRPHSIFGWLESYQNLVEGLFSILTTDELDENKTKRLLNSGHSMLEEYVIGSLWITNRFGKVDVDLAKKMLSKAEKLDSSLTKMASVGPNHINSNNFRTWLFRMTIKSLINLENQQKIKAQQEVDDHKKRLELKEDEHRIEMQKAVIDEHSRMLSYLTHTLNNTLSSGPESARQAMRILGSELYENNREYKAINNIASMFSTFLFAQQLLKTFKLYIAEPETLRANWGADVEGDATIAMVLSVTLRQTLSQVVFASNHQASLQRLLPHKDAGAVKAIRRTFMDEIVPMDVDATNADQVLDWIHDHLGLIQVEVSPDAELHFRSNSTRYTFFFSSFSELVYNALKYSDGAQPIEIFWGKAGVESGEVFLFRCINTWTEDSISSSEGVGKGLVFLERLAEMLGAKFEKRVEDHRFVAEIRFPETLLKRQA